MRDLSFVYSNNPIDSIAKRSLQSGEHCPLDERIKTKFDELYQNEPIKTISFTGPSRHNLEGMKFGRFIVIGYYGKRKNNDSGRWVVKCSCGIYSVRKTKVLKDKNNKSGKMCPKCLTLEDIKNGLY